MIVIKLKEMSIRRDTYHKAVSNNMYSNSKANTEDDVFSFILA
jgi:hypothetical protein